MALDFFWARLPESYPGTPNGDVMWFFIRKSCRFLFEAQDWKSYPTAADWLNKLQSLSPNHHCVSKRPVDPQARTTGRVWGRRQPEHRIKWRSTGCWCWPTSLLNGWTHQTSQGVLIFQVWGMLWGGNKDHRAGKFLAKIQVVTTQLRKLQPSNQCC